MSEEKEGAFVEINRRMVEEIAISIFRSHIKVIAAIYGKSDEDIEEAVEEYKAELRGENDNTTTRQATD